MGEDAEHDVGGDALAALQCRRREKALRVDRAHARLTAVLALTDQAAPQLAPDGHVDAQVGACCMMFGLLRGVRAHLLRSLFFPTDEPPRREDPPTATSGDVDAP
ncbi:hypothetical protein [Streptomyces lydicus]|uniref:hypothetical protein n=1 Tax=Streptomyces lydicus TaxID=47763 RepID=UPI00378BEB87